MALNPEFELLFCETAVAQGLCDMATIDQARKAQQEAFRLHEERGISEFLVEIDALDAGQAQEIAAAVWKKLDVTPAVEGYDNLEKIGASGAAFLYTAHQQSVDRQVVLKIISLAAMRSPATRQRFNQEAKLRARLNHKNIVGSIDFGANNKCYYLVLVLIHGGRNLAEYAADNRIPTPALARYLLGLAEALQYVERQGLVHGNVNPDNVIIIPGGDAWLTGFDFITEIGKPLPKIEDSLISFPPPENPPAQDRKADMYALGCTLFTLLTGVNPRTLPATGKVPVATAVKKSADARLAAIAYTLMQPNPGWRYPDYAALVADCTAVQRKETPRHALPLPSAWDAVARLLPPAPRGRSGRHLLYLGAVAAGLALAVGLFALQGGFAPAAALPPELAGQKHWRDIPKTAAGDGAAAAALWKRANTATAGSPQRADAFRKLESKYPDTAYGKAVRHFRLGQ